MKQKHGLWCNGRLISEKYLDIDSGSGWQGIITACDELYALQKCCNRDSVFASRFLLTQLMCVLIMEFLTLSKDKTAGLCTSSKIVEEMTNCSATAAV